MSADKASALGLDPLCKITGCASAGGEPVPMLLAPIPASRKALARAGRTIDDLDIIEPNEAFASPLLVFADELGYDRYDPPAEPHRRRHRPWVIPSAPPGSCTSARCANTSSGPGAGPACR